MIEWPPRILVAPRSSTGTLRMRARTLSILLALTSLFLHPACDSAHSDGQDAGFEGFADPGAYVGSSRCEACHEEATKAWRRSQHARAERPIDLERDAPAFGIDEPIQHGSVTSRVLRRGDDLIIRTVGRNGELDDFPARRIIGIEPLVQFLVPGERGRYQINALTWDPEKHTWFDVFGDEDRRPEEWGHWANRGMTWNVQCADCHNTNVVKGYDEGTDTYDTRFSEMGVGCEACHGPGGNHIAWQEAHPDRSGDPTLSTLHIEQTKQLIDRCGGCHARRSELREEVEIWLPFLDAFFPELPNETDVYYPDAQVRDEDYEYASFLTSRMFHKGVTCSSCHEPHGGKLRKPGNEMCMSCHGTSTLELDPIDPASHSGHDLAKAGSQCVDCHMPITVYMQRDPRRDHGFTIPDPVLTKELGIPNACSRCHEDKGLDWTIREAERMYGDRLDRNTRHRARMVARARRGEERAAEELIAFVETNQHPTWQAIAAGLLAPWIHREDVRQTLARLTEDDTALVRVQAVRALDQALSYSGARVDRLLEDEVRAVRVAAAWAHRDRVDLATPAGLELWTYLSHNADQPAGLAMKANFALDRGDPKTAARLLERAVSWEPFSAGLRQNYAVTLSQLGRPREALEQVEQACKLDPDNGALWFSLGLSRAENGETIGAVEALEQATRLDPTFSRAFYNLGLARNAIGERDAAVHAMQRATQLEPREAEFWYGLATVLRDANRLGEARDAAMRCAQLDARLGGPLLQALGG